MPLVFRESLQICAVLGLIFFFDSCDNSERNERLDVFYHKPIFKSLSSTESGISFQNQLTEGLNTNILVYEYFYNGGGVAVGDINNDGLEDIYFVSNMGQNEIYLNQGNLKFRNITSLCEASGNPGPWKTGVSMIDINSDGMLDIYLCHSGTLPEEKRKNKLWINKGNDPNGIPHFEEKGEDYGIGSSAFSTQSYFFDFDLDSDLDLLLLNHNPSSLPNLNREQTLKFMESDDSQRGLRLFENEGNNHFIDVTISKGLNGSALSYGLGLAISDFNNDGWPDFYVSNDYDIPDYYYVNYEGKFKNEIDKHFDYTSQFSMGNDAADINNDGLIDLFTLDMLPRDNKRRKLLQHPDNYSKFDHNLNNGFYPQFMRNMLQINTPTGFTEVGMMTQVNQSDWSWSALMADYDNDGDKDIYVTNGYLRDYTNLDFLNYLDNYIAEHKSISREDVMEVITKMPSSNLKNPYFAQIDSFTFIESASSAGLSFNSNSNGAAYSDLDNDGDLDVIVNNINHEAFLFENLSTKSEDAKFIQFRLEGSAENPLGIGAKVTVHCGESFRVVEQYLSRGFQSSVSPVLHVGLPHQISAIDSVVVRFSDGKLLLLKDLNPNQRVTLQYADASYQEPATHTRSQTVFTEVKPKVSWNRELRAVRDFDIQSLLLTQISNQTNTTLAEDINDDGVIDLIVGGDQLNPATLYLSRNNTFQEYSPKYNYTGQYDASICLIDLNGDGLKDIYFGRGGYQTDEHKPSLLQDMVLINKGSNVFEEENVDIPLSNFSTNVITSVDSDKMGKLIFVGNYCIPSQYPTSTGGRLLRITSTGLLEDATESLLPLLPSIGLVVDAKWVDINNGEIPKLVIACQHQPIFIFGWDGEKFVDATSEYRIGEIKGTWNCIEITDVNLDGKFDIIASNIGTNTPWSINQDSPFTLFANDFDKNGSIDPLFFYYEDGKQYPFATRDDIIKQIPSWKKKFPDYESYSDITLEDILSPDQRNNAKKLSTNHALSGVFLNVTTHMEFIAFPEVVQNSPVYAIETLDYDEDGIVDLLLMGNESQNNLRIGFVKSNHGLLLRGKGDGSFSTVPQDHAGLNIHDDIKDIIYFNGQYLFVPNTGIPKAYLLE